MTDTTTEPRTYEQGRADAEADIARKIETWVGTVYTDPDSISVLEDVTTSITTGVW